MIAVATQMQPSRFATSIFLSRTQASIDMPYDTSDRRMSSANEGLYATTALLLRKLPPTTTVDGVKTMLLFAKDLQDIELVPNDRDEDQGYMTAIARFSSVTGASEAQTMLDGKPNSTGHANMVVEILPSSSFGSAFRRNTIDPSSARPVPQAASPMGRASRYNGSFESMNTRSPPPATSPPESGVPDGASYSSVRQAQSPRSQMRDRMRVSGKSVIGEEGGDEETDGLLNDPLGYMRKDNSMGNARRSNGPRAPIGAFNSLSLNTAMSGQQPQGYMTPRSAMHMSPHTSFSPSNGQNMPNHRYPGVAFPPVNPADQNPPCNTLYVGNLPMDTSEDELKAMFSKQRGYKRLCFRTKQNGPMCFVEFEDVSYATKALNELYGAQLHNSVKGGIRLSFSKNPLGVRSGHPGSNTPSTPLGPPNSHMLNGMSPMSPGSFSSANGPPPGLSAPQGYPPTSINAQYAGLGMRSPPPGPNSDGYGGGMFPDHMMGR